MGQHWYDSLAGRVLLTGAILFSPGCETATRRGDVYVPPSAGRVYADDTKPVEEAKKTEDLTESEIEKIVNSAKSVEEVLAPEVVRLKTDHQALRSNLYEELNKSAKNIAIVLVYKSNDTFDAASTEMRIANLGAGISANQRLADKECVIIGISDADATDCGDIARDFLRKYPGKKGVGVPSVLFYTRGDPFSQDFETNKGWILQDVAGGGPINLKSVIPYSNNIRIWTEWNYTEAKEAMERGETRRYENSGSLHKVPLPELVRR